MEIHGNFTCWNSKCDRSLFFFFFLLNSVIPNFNGISKSSVFRRNPLSCLSLAQKMNPSLVTVNAGLSIITMNLTSTNQVGCSTKEICLGLFGVHKSNPDLKRWSISDLLKNILNQFDADWQDTHTHSTMHTQRKQLIWKHAVHHSAVIFHNSATRSLQSRSVPSNQNRLFDSYLAFIHFLADGFIQSGLSENTIQAQSRSYCGSVETFSWIITVELLTSLSRSVLLD